MTRLSAVALACAFTLIAACGGVPDHGNGGETYGAAGKGDKDVNKPGDGDKNVKPGDGDKGDVSKPGDGDKTDPNKVPGDGDKTDPNQVPGDGDKSDPNKVPGDGDKSDPNKTPEPGKDGSGSGTGSTCLTCDWVCVKALLAKNYSEADAKAKCCKTSTDANCQSGTQPPPPPKCRMHCDNGCLINALKAQKPRDLAAKACCSEICDPNKPANGGSCLECFGICDKTNFGADCYSCMHNKCK